MSFIKPPPMPPAVPSSSLPTRDEMAFAFAQAMIFTGQYKGSPAFLAHDAYNSADAMIERRGQS